MAPGQGTVAVRRGQYLMGDLDPAQGSEISKTGSGVVRTADALNRARRTVVTVPLFNPSGS